HRRTALEHHVEIHYCTRCRWLLRAAWMAQELLSTFQNELARLSLVPGTGGVFEVHADGERIWSRAADGGLPDNAGVEQRVRDGLARGRDLGRVDRHAGPAPD